MTPSDLGLLVLRLSLGVVIMHGLPLTYPDRLGSAWAVLMAIGVAAALVSRAVYAPKAAPQAQSKTA